MNDIIITGDFNLNVPNNQYFQKVQSLFNQFALHQTNHELTHFSEHSSASIDVMHLASYISNKDHLGFCRVVVPCFIQEVRYHCPIYSIFKISKPKLNTHSQHIWSYDRGN